jgi:uncharacterized protein YjiS (DUF1127 family)
MARLTRGGGFTVHNTLDLRHTPLKLVALEPLRETAQPFQTRQYPFLAGVTRAIGSLRPWLAGLRDNRQARSYAGSIDDRTLDDIGLTRTDTLYTGPKSSRESSLGLPRDLRSDL